MWKPCAYGNYSGEVGKSKISVDEEKYKELREEYPTIIDNLSKLTSSAMMLLLEDVDEFGSKGKVIKRNKTQMSEVTV